VADLSDRKNVKGLVASITGEHRVDILVNVAGIMRRCDAADYSEEDFDEVMEVNFNATVFLCRDVGKYWIEHSIRGRLINTASLSTFQGGVRMAAYSASKGAIGQLTKALSNEWAGKGIRVNAIAPG
jgi:2-dehydro-3-deoxy-D-gluconate 5-dehydrogenase